MSNAPFISSSPVLRISNRSIPKNWIRSVIIVFALCFCAILVNAQDEEYLAIVSAINQADTLAENGKMAAARTKYLEAQVKLGALKKDYPNWNVKAVAYRMNYLSGKLAVTLRKADQTESQSSAASAGGSSSTNASSLGKVGPVKLLSPGAEPRQKLRFHPKPGDQASLTMTIKTGTTMQMAGQATPAIKLPATQFTLDFTVKDVASNGDITYEIQTKDATVAPDAEVMPQVAEAMKSSLQKFQGSSGTGTMTASGSAKEVDMQTPADDNPQMRQTMNQMKESFSSASSPLPEDPVGVGAKWEIKTKLKSQGMVIDQTATYELISIENERVNLRSSIDQTAANQKIQSPAMPTLKVDLTKMAGHTTGTTTLDLTKIVPITASLNGHTDMSMAMNVGDQKQTMTIGMEQDVRMEGK
jgi:hypothetical protein